MRRTTVLFFCSLLVLWLHQVTLALTFELGPSDTSVNGQTYYFDQFCVICEIDCMKDNDFFETCENGRYFRYGCHIKDFCLNVMSFSYQQSIAATFICMTYNRCKLRQDKEKRTLLERSNYYKLYVDDLTRFQLPIELDDICNPDTGSDPSDVRCKKAKYSELYEKYRMYKAAELKTYFSQQGNTFTVLSEMKRRAFVRLGVPPAYFLYYKLLQDYKDGTFSPDNTQMMNNLIDAVGDYHKYYLNIEKPAPYNLYFDKKFFDVILLQRRKEGAYRLDRIYTLIQEFVEKRLAAFNEAKTIETQIQLKGGTVQILDKDVEQAVANSQDEQVTLSQGLLRNSNEPSAIKVGSGGTKGGRVVKDVNHRTMNQEEIAKLNRKRTDLLRSIYIDMEARLLSDYKKLWKSWTNVNVNRFFVDVAVYGVPGSYEHESTLLGIECPANSELYAQNEKGGFCCVGTLSSYDATLKTYKQCLGKTVCAVKAGNKGFPSCKGLRIPESEALKYQKQDPPVTSAPERKPEYSDIVVTADKWYTSAGELYKGFNRQPSKSEIEAISPPLAWRSEKGDEQVVVETKQGAACTWADAAGMYVFGYVWIPAKGKITLRVVVDDYSWVYINDVKVVEDPCCGGRDHDISTSSAVNRGAWNKVYAVGADGCGKGVLGIEFLVQPHFPKTNAPDYAPADPYSTVYYAQPFIAMGRTMNLWSNALEVVEGVAPPMNWNPSPESKTIVLPAFCIKVPGLWKNSAPVVVQPAYAQVYVYIPFTGKILLKLATTDSTWIVVNDKLLKFSKVSTQEYVENKLERGEWNKVYVVGKGSCSKIELQFIHERVQTSPDFATQPSPFDISRVTTAQWYTGVGYLYKPGTTIEPTKLDVEQFSPVTRWLPRLNSNEPIFIKSESGPACNWKSYIGMYATGYIWGPKTGDVKMEVKTDDMSWVYINGQLVSENNRFGTTTVDITQHINRESWNLVYAVGANGCNDGYLGLNFF